MGKWALWRWTGATIVAVTVVVLCAACAQPAPPQLPIQDKIDRDARLDGKWTGA